MRSAVIELNHDGMTFLERTVLYTQVLAFYADQPFTEVIIETFRRAGLSKIADAIDENRTQSGGVICARPGVGEAMLLEVDWHHWQDHNPDLHAAGIANVMKHYPELLLEAGRALADANAAAAKEAELSPVEPFPTDQYLDLRQKIVELMKDKAKRHIWIESHFPAAPPTAE